MSEIPIRYAYDEEGDILDIFFGENQPAACAQLTDNILLRFDPQTHRPISLTLLNLSVLTQVTDFGPRNYPLTDFMRLPVDWRHTIERIITQDPVNRFLRVSVYSSDQLNNQPIVQVTPLQASAA